jgi:Raf kinase inhibitor-like YbhB/YbcL family protein
VGIRQEFAMRIILAAAAIVLTASPAFAAMTLSSTDLKPGAAMPAMHIYPRCGGQNVAPQVSWSAPPAAARSLVLTMIDQDVKPHLWSHWVVVGLPAKAGALAQGATTLPPGAHAVVSNFGDPGYAGPCPPHGTGTHRYRLTIWALPAATFAVQADEKADDLQASLQAAAVDHASLTATVAAK